VYCDNLYKHYFVNLVTSIYLERTYVYVKSEVCTRIRFVYSV